MQRRTAILTLPDKLRWVETLKRWLFVILLGATSVMAVDAGTDVEPAPEASPADTASADTEQYSALTRLEDLDLLSQGLVEKAGSGATPAHNFRVETRMYRELLRQIMLADRQHPTAKQLPQDLLLEMVRMSALLHAAADCKTGYVIVCPADLMLQLKAQQSRVSRALLTASGKGE
jgi:hypothetical protein